MLILALQRIVFEVFFEIVYFPVWWYSRGILFIGMHLARYFSLGNEVLAPGLWWRNLFVPMYGQYNWQGRIISFIIRLIQGAVRGILLVLWLVVLCLVFMVWVLTPVAIIFGLIRL
jgi:hypothetical protein